MKRVVVTGMAGISPLGEQWETIFARLKTQQNAICYMPEWAVYEGLNTRLAAPAQPFALSARFNRKSMRSMGRVAIMAVCATERALQDANLLEAPILQSGQVGIAYGSSSGTPSAVGDFGRMMAEKTTEGISATTYIKMMSHTAAVNIGIFFGITGRIIPTSSACTSGSQGIGYAYEAIKFGKQTIMIAGGAEELCATEAAVFDTLFATSTRNHEPHLTPRPYDAHRDGLVLGEGAGTLILEEFEHAKARQAPIYAEIVGFGTNSDGCHVTQPNAPTMQQAVEAALKDAHLKPEQIGYINGHGTATEYGDIAEVQLVRTLFGDRTPISSLKSYMGHTLGACGALEAWISIEMMRHNWFAPTINLDHVDPRCAGIWHIQGAGLQKECEYIMSNNFAFGGINTAVIFKRMSHSS
jgi:3-oxoacyl-[acyl-carrier-protein] synthase II